MSRITISILVRKLRFLTRNLTYPKTHTCSLHIIHTQNKEIGFSACSIPISYPPLKLPSFHFHTFFYGLLLMCLAMPNPQFEHFSNTNIILIILDISRQGRKCLNQSIVFYQILSMIFLACIVYCTEPLDALRG